MLKKTKIGEKTYFKLDFYDYHKNSKNWIAELKGTSKTYKFKRDFLQLTKLDDDYYVELNRKEIYEVKHIYYTYGVSVK